MASRLPPSNPGGGDPLVGIHREINRTFDDVRGGAPGGGGPRISGERKSEDEQKPVPRNDEAGDGVSAGAATEGGGSPGGGAMGSSSTEAGSSRTVGP